jgi:hypothetical protein
VLNIATVTDAQEEQRQWQAGAAIGVLPRRGTVNRGDDAERRRRSLSPKGAIYLSQVDGRGGQPTLGQGKPSTGRRVARARGRDGALRPTRRSPMSSCSA